MPQDRFSDIVREYDQQFAPPKVKPAKPAKLPSFNDLIKEVDGQTGSVPTRREQRRQNVTALQDELTATTPQVKPGNTLNVTTGRQYPTPPPPPFQSPIDMRLNAPNEAQKAFDRAAAAVQPAAQPKPRNAFQAPRPKPMLERVMAQQAIERQQPQTVETDPQRLEQLKQATGQQLTEQRDVRMQQSRANVEQMNPLQRMAVRGLAKAGGATDADIRAIAPPQGLEADLMRATNAGVRQVGSIVRGAGEALPGFLPPSVGALRKPIYQGTVGAAKNIQGGLNAVADAVAPDDPADQSFRAKLGRGVGSVGASMGSALATGGGSLAAGTLGALGNLGQVAEERERSGVPVSGLREAGSDALAIATGMTEALGAGRLLNRLGMKTPVIQRVAQALEEGGQEYAQGYLNDINAKLVAAYDPNRAIDDPLSRKRLEEALIGTILGSAGEVADVSMQRAMAAQQNAQQRATRSAIDQRSAANAAAIAPQPVTAQPVTEPLTEPMAAQPQPSAPRTAPIQPQPTQPEGLPRLPARELSAQDKFAQAYGAKEPVENRINTMIGKAETLLGSQNENDRKMGERMMNRALTAIRQTEGYLAEAALPPDAPRPFTAVRDAIEARLKPAPKAPKGLNPEVQKSVDLAKQDAVEAEQAGNYEAAANHWKAAHSSLVAAQREIRRSGNAEQIKAIATDISIADANRRKAMQAARTAQRQANAPTAELARTAQNIPNNIPPVAQPADSAPLLRPDAVQNPEGGIPQMPEPTFTDRLEAAARWDASARGKAKPAKRLLSRIAELGGISDRYAGELQDVKDARRIGVIRQKADMSPDVLARQLQSEGYDVDPEDLNTLWEAARRDIAGRDERTSQTSELERRLAEDEAAYNERQPFDQIVADVDAEPTNRLRDTEYEGGEVQRYSKPLEGQAVEREAFQPDTADLREVREFGKREPQAEQFTEEPPTAPLARRRQPIHPPAPTSPRPVGNRPLSVDVAGTRTPVAMSPDFPRARREMVKQGREVEARLTEGQDKGEFGNVAEAMFKSNTPDVLHGQDSFFHDPDLKGKLGLTREAEMADVRRELKTQLARSLGLTADEVSLSHIKPEVWRAWAKQKGLGREAVRKLEAGIARAERKQRATETNAQIVAEESQRAQSEVRQPAAKAGKSIDAQIKDIRDLQAFDLIDDKEAKRKIAALEAQRPKIAERREAQPRTREDVENSPEFKRWFGDSVVTENGKPGGKPLVVYHGTGGDFDQFDMSKADNVHTQSTGVPMHFFTNKPEIASTYSAWKKNPSTLPAYVSIKNPLVIEGFSDWTDALSEVIDQLPTYRTEQERKLLELKDEIYQGREDYEPTLAEERQLAAASRAVSDAIQRDVKAYQSLPKKPYGYDGIIIRNVADMTAAEPMGEPESYSPYGDIYAVFSPNQIKSAIGNRGTFDPNSAKITERRSEAMPERYTGRQLFENAQLTFRPARNRPATLVANDWGGAMLNQLLNDTFGITTTDANFTIAAKDAKDLRDYLAEAKDSGIYEPAQVANMDAMLKQMDAAIADAEANQQDVAFVTRRPAEPISATKAKIRHETAHISQSRIAADLSALTGKNWLDSQPNAKDIHKELDRRGYAPETHDYEAAAFVASGDYSVFGMNLDQAAKFLSDYFGAVVEKHGKRALQKFGAIDPKLQPTLEAARRETGTTRSSTDGRTNEAAPETPRRIGAASEARGSSAGVRTERRERRQRVAGSGFSFGRVPEGRGQVLASFPANIQTWLGKNKPKEADTPTKPEPVPADWNQQKWAKKAMDALVTRDMPKEDREKFFDFSTKKPERLALLQKYMPSEKDIDALAGVIDRANNAIKNNDGDDLREAVWAARAIVERPATNAEKASALMRAAMFSTPRGRMRDLISNFAEQKLATVARIPGSAADAAFTTLRRMLTGEGERTFLGPRPAEYLKNRAADWAKQWKQTKDVWKGKHVDALEDVLQHREVNFDNKFLDKTTKAVFRAMGAADQWFFVKEYQRAIREQAELAARADVRSGVIAKADRQKQTDYYAAAPTTEMKAMAELAAKQMVFRNPNFLSDKVFKPLRENLPPGANFALDIVMPVDRTPTNIILTALEYSPLGAVKLAGQMATGTAKATAKTLRNRKDLPTRQAIKKALDEAFPPEKQRAMSRLFGRTVTGTSAPVALGFALASAGMATGFYDEDDPGEEAERREEGKMPNSVKIGGRWYELGGIAPLGMLIGLGATLHREMHAETLDPEKRYARLAKGFGNMAMELPALESAKQTVKMAKAATGKPSDLGRIAGNIGARFVPGLVSDIGQATPYLRDPYEREVKAPKSGEKNTASLATKAGREFAGEFGARIPGVRRLLPPKMNTLTGKPVETEWSDVIDPFRSRKAVEPGSLSGVKAAQMKFDISSEVRPKIGEPDEIFQQRKQRVEGWMNEYGDKLLSHPSYTLLTESQRQAAMESLRRRISNQQNKREPKRDLFGNIESFAPEKVIQSVLKSEATHPKREAGKLWSPPAQP